MTTKSPKKIKFLSSEKWKELPAKKGVTRKRYAVSSHGRVVSFYDKIEEGTLLKAGLTQKYPSINIKVTGKPKTYYIHRLVAEQFVRKASPKHNFVIHLDHKKTNNLARNLKWVTHEAQIEHAKDDPAFLITARTRKYKLNEDRVRTIKKKLASGKVKMKALAKQFGVTEMQLYRIKSGENWSHVKI